jgi:Trypsin-co-occurring domain 1
MSAKSASKAGEQGTRLSADRYEASAAGASGNPGPTLDRLGIRRTADDTYLSTYRSDMPKMLELDIPGGTVLFEVPVRDSEIAAVSRTGEVIEKITKSMGEVFGVVGGIAKGFHEAIQDAPVEAAQLEFGLQFSASGRLYVVDVGAQSTIKVTLTVTPSVGSD